MALVSIVNLAERLLNQTAGQAQDAPVQPKPARPTAEPGALAAPPEDQFTPSVQNEAAQAAGLFTVRRSPVFSPAADSLLASPATPQATAPPATIEPANTANTQNPKVQLQKLNNTLAALGLSRTDIQRVDNIASLIETFDPTVFTSLVYQLKALARQASPQTAANPAAPSTLTADVERIVQVQARQTANTNPPEGGNPAPARATAATP
jgi:hypothetical protein